MLFVVFHLDGPPSLCLSYGVPNTVRFCVGIENDLTGDIPGRSPHHLDKRLGGTEKPFPVCIEYGHERDLRKIHPFPEKIDPHKG